MLPLPQPNALEMPEAVRLLVCGTESHLPCHPSLLCRTESSFPVAIYASPPLFSLALRFFTLFFPFTPSIIRHPIFFSTHRKLPK